MKAGGGRKHGAMAGCSARASPEEGGGGDGGGNGGGVVECLLCLEMWEEGAL